MPTSLLAIAKKAQERKETRFFNLYRLIDENFLRECWRDIRKNAAYGVDRISAQQYAENLVDNIRNLVERLKSKTYRARLVRRHWIPKPDGRQRPLGIPVVEDKLLQLAVTRILEAIYEQDFLRCSYGYRPNKGALDAVDKLTIKLQFGNYNFVVEADIQGFFDHLRHEDLLEMLSRRIGDQSLLRLIQKWLKAGVMEEGKWSEVQTGSPQGSVISPLLANIYLHYSFDLWVNAWRKKWAQGEVVVIRFADDTIVGFQYQRDADRFLENLRERLGKFGLELHPDKTRRIEFGRFAEQNRKRRGEGKPETFDFLGFTHISGKNGLGRFAVRRTTIRKRMRAKLRQVKQQLRERMHDPVPQTGGWVQSVVQGYFNYYAVPGNLTSLGVFRDRVLVLWWRALRRRSQKRRISWTRILALAQRWLPPPQVLHPFPDARFAATYLR